MGKKDQFAFKKLIVPGAVMLAFWTLAVALWQTSGEIMALFFFGYIGTSVGVGLGLYATLPKKNKPLGRRLALTLKANRAFCKYLCPVSVPLKLGSRFALLKVKGNADKCNNCQACTKMCPMDIRISDYTRNGQRVLSTECSLCQTCITVCSKDALKHSFGFELGGKDLLRERGRVEASHGNLAVEA